MQIGKPDAKAAARQRVFDAERDDQLLALAGDGDLAADVFALVALIGEDQQHRQAVIERRCDLVVERLARRDVARGDPTQHAAPLQFADDLQRRRAVFADVADEQEGV